MTQEQAITAYEEKYSDFPDLVSRIVSQFNYGYWQTNNPGEDTLIKFIGAPESMQEDYRFWENLISVEKVKPIERGHIDFLYQVLNIEQ